MKFDVVIHGFGNIGKYVLKAIKASSDINCLGVIRRLESFGKQKDDLLGVKEFTSIKEVLAEGKKPKVAILCGPSRNVEHDAPLYLLESINTVDSFDIHSDLTKLLAKLEPFAKKSSCASITGAGWDPGTDSILRAILEAMVPVGTTFTNFGRGKSMGHSVAARAIKGVKDAISITIPMGGGKHSRLVYVLPETGMDTNAIKDAISKDPYFVNDPLDIRFVDSIESLQAVSDNSHGVLMERIGASSTVSNQRIQFDMRIDNPALTAQVLVSSARAVTRMQPGAYTLIDVPPVNFLPGDRLSHIARIV